MALSLPSGHLPAQPPLVSLEGLPPAPSTTPPSSPQIVLVLLTLLVALPVGPPQAELGVEGHQEQDPSCSPRAPAQGSLHDISLKTLA
jgi:hypothetical protein